jgi:hypothetical protein
VEPVSSYALRDGLASIVVGVAVLFLSACGSSTPKSALGAATERSVVRPFSEVQTSGIRFEADPNNPSRGVMHVTTGVPMICAIVWGPDATFGRFNNSLSMNGTGITQHDVSLPNVDPGATYTYVIEGVTADGSLYRSTVASFIIPAGNAPPTPSVEAPGTNIAPQATAVSASSAFSPAFAARNAIDNDLSTEWATAGDGDNATITIDLGHASEIKGAEFVTRSMADGSAIASTYTVSVDGADALGPFPASTLAKARPATFTARGQIVTVKITHSSGGNVGAAEIRVFA